MRLSLMISFALFLLLDRRWRRTKTEWVDCYFFGSVGVTVVVSFG